MRVHDIPDTEMGKLSQRLKWLWWPGKTKSHLFILPLLGHIQNKQHDRRTRPAVSKGSEAW